MTIVNAAGRAMTDVTDDSQLCDVTDDQKPPSTRSYLTVGLPDPHPVQSQYSSLKIRSPCSLWTSSRLRKVKFEVDVGF